MVFPGGSLVASTRSELPDKAPSLSSWPRSSPWPETHRVSESPAARRDDFHVISYVGGGLDRRRLLPSPAGVHRRPRTTSAAASGVNSTLTRSPGTVGRPPVRSPSQPRRPTHLVRAPRRVPTSSRAQGRLPLATLAGELAGLPRLPHRLRPQLQPVGSLDLRWSTGHAPAR